MKLSQRRLARPSLGGVLATRQGSLTLALLCAACAAGVLMFTLGRYKSNLKPTVQQSTVLVATREIHKGTPVTQIGAENLYRPMPVANSQVTPGAITDAAALVGQTAQADILPGQQLSAADFSTVVGLGQTLTQSQRAVAVSIGESPGITDALQPGDRVDVYADLTNAKTQISELVLLDAGVQVLKPATPVAVKAGGQAITGSSMLLALDDSKVGQVIWSSQHGSLYLALRPLKASSTPTYGVDLASVLADNNGFVFGPTPTNPTTP